MAAAPRLSRTALAFAAVGMGGMAIDLVVFNTLRLGALGAAFSLASKPLTASVISASFAIVFNWLGSRYWAFRSSRREDAFTEFAQYVAVALLGLGIGLATLAFTHYTLGFTSLAADNVSKNVIGLALGTVTRFLLLRFWVWGRNPGSSRQAVRSAAGRARRVVRTITSTQRKAA
jgi:putative flippase GtrA